LVETVIVTVFPTSPAAGVYVKPNVLLLELVGVTLPAPFSVMVTLVALPPKVLPLTVIGEVPQVLPLALLKFRVGAFTQPQSTLTVETADIQPVTVFLTLICLLPLVTLLKILED
jgi:hypothetical protein